MWGKRKKTPKTRLNWTGYWVEACGRIVTMTMKDNTIWRDLVLGVSFTDGKYYVDTSLRGAVPMDSISDAQCDSTLVAPELFLIKALHGWGK